MSKLIGKSLLVGSTLLGAALIATSSVSAEPVPNNGQLLDQLNRYSVEGQNSNNSLDQVTSVDQLRDVSPSDWAYPALQQLVENYNCIAGYPDGTFRGNKPLSRYEFAAGLNACLNAIERRLGGGDSVDPNDLATLRRLVQEFEGELKALGARVDDLEGRVGFLEDHQFSTTTKLAGEVTVVATDIFGGKNYAGGNLGSDNTILADRVRLQLNTSFTGKDKLITRLAAGNANTIGSALANDGSGESVQTFNGPNNSNDVIIDWAAYYTNIKKAQVYIAAAGGLHADYADTLNPYFQGNGGDDSQGALSTFSYHSPIYRVGGGSGAGIKIPFGKWNSELSFGYLAGNAPNDPGAGNGLFNGDYSALGQLKFSPSEKFDFAFTYVHGYHPAGSAIFDYGGNNPLVGTSYANATSSAKVTNSYGGEVAFKLSDKVSLSGYFAYTDAILFGAPDREIWTYGMGVAFPDFGKEGNLLGIFAGAQPYSISAGASDTPFQVEAFYKYKVNDNIAITPGVIWLTAPGQSNNADDAVIGTVRTTFSF